MKTLLVVSIISILGFPVFAQYRAFERTYNTLFTCEQGDGDTWHEVGLVKTAGSPSGYNFVVVKHLDNSKRLLIANRPAVLIKQSTLQQEYQDRGASLRLNITRSSLGYSGKFTMLDDGPNSISNVRMDCFVSSKISY